MVRVALSLLLLVCLGACRATFDNVAKPRLQQSSENLEVPPPDVEPPADKEGDGDGDGDGNGDDDRPFENLEDSHELSREESEAYDCYGILVVTERGPDRNRDKVLQPIEVTDVSTECRPDGDRPNQNCPGQSGGACNDPSQNSKTK